MRKTFPGYYKDAEIGDILNNNKAIIVLDPIVLCNLYGYNKETWKPVLDLISTKKDMLWLPYNMAYAYHKGIMPMLVQKIQLMNSINNRLKQASDMLNLVPFEKGLLDNYQKSYKFISSLIDKEINALRQKGKKDCEIRETIANLYDGKIGLSNNDPDPNSFKVKTYTESTEVDAITGNTATCQDKIELSGTPKPDKNDIILHTLIKLSKDKNKDVIYVLNEPSEYWSIFIEGTSYGPHPDHQTYFSKYSQGHNLFCFSFASFVHHLSHAVKKQLPFDVLENLKQLSYGTLVQNDGNDFL